MLISDTSLLRRIPTSVDRRVVLYLDGIRYSIQVADLVYDRLVNTLHRIARLPGGSRELGQAIVEATSDAWSFIDSLHRLRELVQQLPGLRHHETAVQVFLKSTRAVDEFRNYVQHFRNGIDRFAAAERPLWGALSWPEGTDLEAGRCPIIVPGTFYPGVVFPGCVFDPRTGRFEGGISIETGDQALDLTEIRGRLEQFVGWFEGWFSTAFADGERSGSDVHLQMRIRIAGRQPEPASP